MASLLEQVNTFCSTAGFNKTYWIAYSGGLDSSVLLHLLAALKNQQPLDVKAIYVNHGISPHATVWAAHCEKTCQQLQIDFTQQAIVLPQISQGQSLEAVLRNVRYDVFAKLLMPNDYLLTAHQQDDQAETVLLQLFRGAGPKGLAAMPKIKPFAKGFHARPLLDIPRETLEHYAKQHNIAWIEDESNEDKHFTRNFLRHDVIPLLKKRWPTVTNTLQRVSDHCAAAEEFITLIARDDLNNLVSEQDPTRLSIKKLLELDPLRQIQVLRVWLHQLGFLLPSQAKMHQLLHHFLQAAPDKSPHLISGNVELRRYRDELYAMHTVSPSHSMESHDWDLSQALVLPTLGTLSAEKTSNNGLSLSIPRLTVRFRQGGETCHRGYHHKLKKLFQAWGIPPWERERIPLLFVGEQLAAVAGLFLSDAFKANQNEEGYCIKWQPFK